MNDEIYKQGFKDSRGNTLVFTREGDKMLMIVDGSDCSEGIEEIVGDEKNIVSVLEWYGYNELAVLFTKKATNN